MPASGPRSLRARHAGSSTVRHDVPRDGGVISLLAVLLFLAEVAQMRWSVASRTLRTHARRHALWSTRLLTRTAEPLERARAFGGPGSFHMSPIDLSHPSTFACDRARR